MYKFAIAYMTCRKEPHFEWFMESLARQCQPQYQELIIVDFYADEPGRREAVAKINSELGFDLKHVTPKPSVWQGKHRLTKENYFDAGNARNTALCLTSSTSIAYCDDLSVLAPEWYKSVMEAVNRPGYTFGSYRKVMNLVVERGLISSFSHHDIGQDVRRCALRDLRKVAPCHPDWLFGCSLVCPTEALISAGGWPEKLCAGMGYEDSCFARIVRNRKERTYFDPMMMTYESEEDHHRPDGRFLRSDPCRCNPCSSPKDDKSHAMMAKVEAATESGNDYDIRKLRDSVMNGGEFPIPTEPTTEWFTGIKLCDL